MLHGQRNGGKKLMRDSHHSHKASCGSAVLVHTGSYHPSSSLDVSLSKLFGPSLSQAEVFFSPNASRVPPRTAKKSFHILTAPKLHPGSQVTVS